ncbi:MAG: DUF3793 family protein [Ruminococcaceae bacterium]|nr:DUF3793 family protein [Oscillospiraceae bacterium]
MTVFSSAHRSFELTLAWHCAPSLVGIKAADMICWEPPARNTAEFLQHYTESFARLGICLRILRPCGSRLLMLVFRPQRLEQCLSQPDVQTALAKEGYPAGQPIKTDALLNHLCHRLAQDEFPHEIGLFLGYPVADVEGFRIHKGHNCKLSGCWKVYGDADYARQMFERFLRCRQALTRRVEEGLRLDQILVPMSV